VDEPVIALDGDAAGLRAAARTAELALPLLQPGKTLLFALMPEGKDPDDLIREKGRTGIDSVIESAEPLSRFLWRCEIEKQSLDTPERRAAFDNRVRTMLGGITDQGVRHHYETQFREWRHDLFSTTRDAWKPQNPGGRKGWSKVAPPAPARTETRHSALVTGGGPDLRYALEQQILRLALASPEAMAACGDSLAESEFANRDLDSIRSALISAFFDIASPETGMTVSKLHAETRRRLKPDCTALFERLADFTGDSSDSDHLTSALDRHIAICAREVEKRDAEHSFSRDGDERAFQRMVAARAAHRTALERVMPVVSEAESGSVQGFIDGELWKKRKKKTDRRNGGTRRDDGAGEMTRE
jgi:DNA primase